MRGQAGVPRSVVNHVRYAESPMRISHDGSEGREPAPGSNFSVRAQAPAQNGSRRRTDGRDERRPHDDITGFRCLICRSREPGSADAFSALEPVQPESFIDRALYDRRKTGPFGRFPGGGEKVAVQSGGSSRRGSVIC